MLVIGLIVADPQDTRHLQMTGVDHFDVPYIVSEHIPVFDIQLKLVVFGQ